jgi:hypothetical protein
MMKKMSWQFLWCLPLGIALLLTGALREPLRRKCDDAP